MKEAGKAAAAGKSVAVGRVARSCGDGAATGIVVAAAAWSEVAAAPLSMAAAAVGKTKPVEAGGSANEVREFELTLECKLQEVQTVPSCGSGRSGRNERYSNFFMA